MSTTSISFNTKASSNMLLLALLITTVVLSTSLITPEQKTETSNVNTPIIAVPQIVDSFTVTIGKEVQSLPVTLVSSGSGTVRGFIEAQNKPIFVSGNTEYQSLMTQIISHLPQKIALDSLVIKHAPDSIIENINIIVVPRLTNVQSIDLGQNLKMESFINQTLGNPISFFQSNGFIVRNSTLTGYTSTTGSFSVIEGIASTDIEISNNTFSAITSTTGSVTGVNLTTVSSLAGCDRAKIYNNTFTGFSGQISVTGINIGGIPSVHFNDIIIANNTFDTFSGDGFMQGIIASFTNNLTIDKNEFKWFTSVNGNITGIEIHDSSAFLLQDNILDQFTASFSSFDFSGIKHIYAIKVLTASSSRIYHNYINQLDSKSKAYGLYIKDFPSGTIANNTVQNIQGKSILGIVVTGINGGLISQNNTIMTLDATATESIGMSIKQANNAVISFNKITGLTSASKINGLLIEDSAGIAVSNNTLQDYSTSSPVYSLEGISLLRSATSQVQNNSLLNFNSQQTFVQGLLLENSPSGTLKWNSLKNLGTTFSSAFGIVLDNSGNTNLITNTLDNITSTAQAMSLYSSKPMINVELTGGYGLFFYTSNNLQITSNNIANTVFWLNYDESITDISFNSNIVDGTPLTFQSMTHPLDFSFEEGNLAQNITWIANDSSASSFQIFVDSQEVASGFWFDGQPIIYGVADVSALPLGPHEIQLVLTDQNNHKISDIVNVNVIELVPPTIDETNDTTVLNGTLGHSLIWTVYDQNPGSYQIFKNGSVVSSAIWSSGLPISYSIDGLQVGTYNFTLLAIDSSGNVANDTIFVYVLTNGTLSLLLRPATTSQISYGSTNDSLSWVLKSVKGGTYTIFVDNVSTKQGTWNPDQTISFNLKNLPLGEHTIKLEAKNEFGIQVNDVITVTVIIPRTSTSAVSTFIPSFSHFTEASGILGLFKIDTGSLFYIIIFSILFIGSVGVFYYQRQKMYKSNVYVNKAEKIEKFIELGNAFLKMGNTLKAISSFKRALRGSIKIADTRLQAISLKSLGQAILTLKNLDDESIQTAKENLEEALELAKNLSDKHLQVECYSLLGDCFSNLGSVKETLEEYRTAVKLARDIDDELSEIDTLMKTGIYYEVIESNKKAIKKYQEALKVAKTIKESKSVTKLEHLLANVYRSSQQYEEAHKHYTIALKAAERNNDVTTQARVMGDIGRAFYLDGKVKKAEKSFYGAIDLAKIVGDEQIEAFQNHNLAIMDFDRDQFENALNKIDLALSFDRVPAFLDLKGDILIALHKIGQALSNYKKALKIAKNSNDIFQQFDTALKIYEIQRRIASERQIQKARTDVEEVNAKFDLYNKKISSRVNSSLRVRTQKLDEKIMMLIDTNVIKKVEITEQESSTSENTLEEKGESS